MCLDHSSNSRKNGNIAKRSGISSLLLILAIFFLCPSVHLFANDAKQAENKEELSLPEWKKKAAEYARILSGVKWTPVADTMPWKAGYFEKGVEYSGVPYSGVSTVGRYIGFEIYLKTFLAAVENPQSVLYTETLKGRVSKATTYYGLVCSNFTSYAYQCTYWYTALIHVPPFRKGLELVEPHDAQSVEVGDFIYTPPREGTRSGVHVELITEVVKKNGVVTHVRIEDSWPKTTRNILRPTANFNSHIKARARRVYRITDIDLWREENRAENYLFPNYAEDSATPKINRVLLLDLGDWVPYNKEDTVKINVMDRDSQGVKSLVIKRGEQLIEEIPLEGPGIIERTFAECGDYTAHCVMKDGSLSQACEFSVCELDLQLSKDTLKLSEPYEVEFSSNNLKVVMAHISKVDGKYKVWINDEDRKNGKFNIPANLIDSEGRTRIWLFGENKYGRLKKEKAVMAIK